MSILTRKSRMLLLKLIIVFHLLIANVSAGADHFLPKLSAEELKKIIQIHSEWQIAYKNDYTSNKAVTDNRRAMLIGADLKGANLKGVNLVGALLLGADLRSANLESAKLNGADLGEADLSNAILCGADLCGSRLVAAKLVGADLGGADLSNAILWGADLSNAKLMGTKMENADLRWYDHSEINVTNLNGAVFEPNTLPNIINVSVAKNLD